MKPDVAQRADQDGEIASTGRTEQAGDVLNDDPASWSNKLIGAAGELEEQAGSFACEPGASAGDREVLAREASTEKVNAGVGAPIPVPMRIVPISSSRGLSIISSDQPNVLVAGDSGPVLGEDSSAPGVRLSLEHDSHPGSLQTEVEAANATEQRSDIHEHLQISGNVIG